MSVRGPEGVRVMIVICTLAIFLVNSAQLNIKKRTFRDEDKMVRNDRKFIQLQAGISG
jgi:hypothetical protein